MILNEGQPEAWRVHTTDDASPTLYAERPPATLRSIKKRKYDLMFPLDFAGTLCARDGIKTGPHSPNGEDAYDRKLVVMIKRRKKRASVLCFENHQADARVRKIDIAMTIGAERNSNASNNNPLVLTCYSNPQLHSITRGYMNNCAPTLNAAAGMSGNNRPFIVKADKGKKQKHTYNRPRNELFVEDNVAQCLGASQNMSPLNNRIIVAECIKRDFGRTNNPPVVYGLDKQGGKGGANQTENISPTICSDSHGTPHGVCVPMHGSKKGVPESRTTVAVSFLDRCGNN